MAAAVSTQTVRITINEIEIDVPKDELIVESVKRLGLEIPIFCYHPRMKPVGMCRMCLVEIGFKQADGSVRKMPKPQAACTLPASEGMAIYTDSESIHRDRKGVLEFLLVNHPLDCPICDRGGECPLQNNTLFYGPSTSRFTEIKRHLPKAYPLSQYVTLDLERCIQCGRCVRFTEEISGDSQLAFRFRGAQMQPSTFKLTDFQSKFSGNVIEICPVGALTSAKYRFRARPWDLETRPAICTNCSNGCNVWFDYRGSKFVRMNGRTNEAVNEEWTCDQGKFGQEFYNSDKRLVHPLRRNIDSMELCSWAEAYEEIQAAFKPGGSEVAALVGDRVSNEALFVMRRLFQDGFGSTNFDHRWTKLPATDRFTRPRSSIADFESKSGILVFGASLAEDLPILFLRVRKAWFKHGAKVVIACDRPTDADSFAHILLRYNPGTEGALAKGLLAAATEQGAVKGSTDLSVDQASMQTGVAADQIREAARVLGSESAIITTHRLLDTAEAEATATALGQLGEFNCYALGANTQGASDLGFASAGAEKILQDCRNGSVKALWLVGCDPFALHPDRELVHDALENVEFLVIQDIEENEACLFSSIILPMKASAEQDGTYTNMEGRVQRMKQVIPGPEDSKPAWRIFSECLLRLKPGTPFFNAGEVMDEIAREIPWYAPASYSNLDGEGVIVKP